MGNTGRESQDLGQNGLHWFHWLVISLSLVLTFSAWYLSKTQVEAKNALQFDREAEQVIALVLERMEKYENGLWGGVGLIHGSQHVSHDEWVEFSRALALETRYPGVNGIGVIYNVPRLQIPEFLKQQRERRPDFRIHPEHDEIEAYPITYIEPVEFNRQAVGLDMAHEANRYTAAKKSRDTGTAQITGPITLVQDEGKTPGFLFYAPFYEGAAASTVDARRSAFKGVVYAPFIMHNLMKGVLEKANRHVGIQISDGADTLYDEHVASEPEFDPNPLYARTKDIELYGRIWTFDIRSARSFREATSNSQPLTILIGGLVIDALFLGLFIVISGSHRRAVAYAEEMNTELVQKSKTLKKSNHDLEQLSHLVSHDLKTPLRGIKTLAAFIEEDSKDDLNAECQTHLDKMVQLVGKMERLLGDLLSYSEVVNRGFEEPLELIRLESMIDEICEMNDYDRSAISVTESGPRFAAARFPLRTVLNNLISNSFNYGRADDGSCAIEVGCQLQGDGMLAFSVRDFGPGIPEGSEENVFKMFRRLNLDARTAGSGVGLALVKRLVLNAGGRIRVVRTDDVGVEFAFTWPFADPDRLPSA